MKQIRYKCFETNSSSTHALSINESIDDIDLESIKPVIVNDKKIVIIDLDDLDESPHNDALTKLKYVARWIVMKQNSMLYCYDKLCNMKLPESDDEFGDIISLNQLYELVKEELKVDDVVISTKYFNHICLATTKFLKYNYFVDFVYTWTSFYLEDRLKQAGLKDTNKSEVKHFIFNKKYYIGTVDYGMELKIK